MVGVGRCSSWDRSCHGFQGFTGFQLKNQSVVAVYKKGVKMGEGKETDENGSCRAGKSQRFPFGVGRQANIP